MLSPASVGAWQANPRFLCFGLRSGGLQMPVSTARQIEFWLRQYAPDVEIKLIPLALSREQIIHYRLPRIPIKESDLRKKDFQGPPRRRRCRVGCFMEALHSGELSSMVRTAIEPYFDRDLAQGLADAHNEAMDEIEDAWEELIQQEAGELEAIKRDADAIAKKYHPEAAKLRQAFDLDMKPVEERLAAVQHAVEEKARQFEIDLPDRPEVAEADVDESAWPLDSGRWYMDQLDFYRRHKGTAGS
jgi:hypothetical protein